ncbi:hypothetical protein BMS3Bbin15_00773 [archaeon BMS3Bbin15]|nr:hypothetical protein BMS3Bbin15_00773 [archaeon BMS3Bbin15]
MATRGVIIRLSGLIFTQGCNFDKLKCTVLI